MKKILVLFFGLAVVACSAGGGFSDKISKAIEEERLSVFVNDMTDFEWDDLRIFHPYESRTVFGKAFDQSDDSICLWVFAKDGVVVKEVSIAREKVECIDLPTETFSRSDARFLIKDGKLSERKKFKLPSKK